jgi:hypothetical protein
VLRDVIAPWNAVAVEHQDVVTPGGKNAAVARQRGAESLVGLPYMLQRHRRARAQRRHAFAGGGAGAVVGHNDLEVVVGLPEAALDHGP